MNVAWSAEQEIKLMEVVKKVSDDRAADTSNLQNDLAFWKAVAQSEGLGGRTPTALCQRWRSLRKILATHFTLPQIKRRRGKALQPSAPKICHE